jgi:dihydroxyacetone kinase
MPHTVSEGQKVVGKLWTSLNRRQVCRVPEFYYFISIVPLKISRNHFDFALIPSTFIMSLVVEQTLPYSKAQLKLGDPKRWSRLFPLMRPSIKAVETASGQTVVVDTALANSKDVLIAAIGNAGNFSSKILSESHLAAFTIEQYGRQAISAEEIAETLQKSGFPTENGVVVVRVGSKEDLRVAHFVVELSVDGELKLDHILSLLLATKPEVK